MTHAYEMLFKNAFTKHTFVNCIWLKQLFDMQLDFWFFFWESGLYLNVCLLCFYCIILQTPLKNYLQNCSEQSSFRISVINDVTKDKVCINSKSCGIHNKMVDSRRFPLTSVKLDPQTFRHWIGDVQLLIPFWCTSNPAARFLSCRWFLLKTLKERPELDWAQCSRPSPWTPALRSRGHMTHTCNAWPRSQTDISTKTEAPEPLTKTTVKRSAMV